MDGYRHRHQPEDARGVAAAAQVAQAADPRAAGQRGPAAGESGAGGEATADAVGARGGWRRGGDRGEDQAGHLRAVRRDAARRPPRTAQRRGSS